MSNNVIRKATNRWAKGLVMDFSPENTQNEVLTHALNATLLTFNGNELSLQNDMGNARVETAFLPEGYIPVGTCEYGGIIYIVSYNPLEDKSQIGCFPSPERNISREETGRSDKISISYTDFQEIENKSLTGHLKNTTYKILLRDNNLNPGDKYIVYSNDNIYDERIQDMFKWDGTEFQQVENPLIKLNLVSIQDDGKIIYLDSDVRQYEVIKNNNKFSYHILGQIQDSATNAPIDIDSYRNVLSSGYSVFKEKTSGKLALLAELITIDSFSLTYSIQAGSESEDVNGEKYKDYHIVLHTEISPEITSKNYNTVPKLKYYHSDKQSQMLQIMKNDSLKTIDLQGSTEEYKLSDVFNTNVEEIDNRLKKIGLDSMYLPFNTRNYHKNEEQEYIPDLQTGNYDDIIYQTIKIPKVLSDNKINLPFIYNYTITPCMEYGKLDYLSVSNTVNFNNLFDFEASKFNTWKYRIDGNQLMLTFGAEVYDTFSDKKVTGLVLEFYDWRGFAGSLEISNKKAYSGTFTKIISLNTLNAISTNKISDSGYTKGPKRNINIYKNDEDKQYYLNGDLVSYDSNTKQWDINDSDNDCGTLYSNVIYGVKAYFKVSENAQDQFIKKESFFLFTFPIYNEYYYTVQNYNDIHNPKLKMFLTYVLKDFSEINPLQNGDYTDGYNENDFKEITSYLEGNYENTELEVTRYFHVSGETKLKLEVGLLKEYETYNLSCKKEINDGAKCNLQLSGNISGSFDTNAINILEGTGLQFNDGESSFELMTDIPIKYDFYIGYSIKVVNIRDSSIPMTTVCALYHKQGEHYNEADFGIRTNLNSKNLTEYLSNFVFYNSGSSVDYKFGVAKMIDIRGESMEDQCIAYHSYDATTTEEKTPTRLNAGTPLKKMLPYMGKYMFCQPHTHYMLNGFKNNLKKSDGGEFYLSTEIPKDNVLKANPLYNLSLNTVNSVMHQAEFISTSHGGNVEVNETPYKQYVGFTAPQVAKFNRCMLNTMKSVYAYNPDYDTIQIRLGDVQVEQQPINFTSNIICTSLSLSDSLDLNQYITIGGVSIKDYLNDLTIHSNITVANSDGWIPTLRFEPDYTYCGTQSNPYLVSPLTYNIETPKQIYDDLMFEKSNKVAVRHHDNNYNFITGDINKNLLYGWGFNKLIQLDVTNYQISWDGSLMLPQRNTYKEIEKTLESLNYTFNESKTLSENVKETLTLGTLEINDSIVNINCLLQSNTKGTVSINSENSSILNVKLDLGQNTHIITQSETTRPEILTPMFPPTQWESIIPQLQIEIQLVTENNEYVKTSEFSITVSSDEHMIEVLKEGKGVVSLFTNLQLHFPSTIKYILYQPESYEDDPNNVIHVIKTTDYGFYPKSNVYDVSYNNVCLVGSLITLNDLVYYPEKDGHRLFMRNNCFSEVFDEKNKIYYRGNSTDSIKDTDKNSLYICYGPCFNGIGFDDGDPEK